MHRFPIWDVPEKPTQTVSKSGRIAIDRTDAERMFHYYVKPQSTGNRTDMRWATITNETGNGLHVTAAHPWQFSIVPFADSNIDASTHINQLKRSGTVTVHMDAEQAGVGTATCGPVYCLNTSSR